jgi:hypothetical protein
MLFKKLIEQHRVTSSYRTVSVRDHEMIVTTTYQRASELGFPGSARKWERLLGAVPEA